MYYSHILTKILIITLTFIYTPTFIHRPLLENWDSGLKEFQHKLCWFRMRVKNSWFRITIERIVLVRYRFNVQVTLVVKNISISKFTFHMLNHEKTCWLQVKICWFQEKILFVKKKLVGFKRIFFGSVQWIRFCYVKPIFYWFQEICLSFDAFSNSAHFHSYKYMNISLSLDLVETWGCILQVLYL